MAVDPHPKAEHHHSCQVDEVYRLYLCRLTYRSLDLEGEKDVREVVEKSEQRS